MNGLLALLALVPAGAAAQSAPPVELRAIVAEALARNPEIQAALRTAAAASARVPQAGALPDPVLSAGLMNLPTGSFRLAGDDMAMATIQVAQMVPAPGSLAARAAVAREAHRVAEQQAEELALAVVVRLKAAYYEAYFVERAVEILLHNRAVLEGFSEVALGRFGVGDAPQQDVLRAQTEVTRLDEQLSALRARHAAAWAGINAILQRPATQLLSTVYPAGVRALAETAPLAGAFTSAALDRGFGSGFPELTELQTRAARERPLLRAQNHRVEQARAGVRLADRERFPDLELMLAYGTQGSGGMNRISAMVAAPLPIFAPRKQRQAAVEARHELEASELEARSLANDVDAEIATQYAALIRAREQIVLLSDGVIPQARAAIESAVIAYQTGSVDFLSLLEAQATLFRSEIDLARQLADFGHVLAQLERAAGRDLIVE